MRFVKIKYHMETLSVSPQPWQRWIAYIANSLLVVCAFALPISTSVTDIAFPLAVVLSLVGSDGRDRWSKLTSPVALTLIIFFVLFLVGTTYTVGSTHDVMHRLLQIACLLFSAFLITSITNDRVRSLMINAFLLAMVITLFLSYLKYYVLHMPSTERLDVDNVFKDHIIQNFLMVIAAFIFIYRWLNKYRFRWVYAVLIVLMTYNILFMSSGRSGYFIFAALLIYTGFSYFGWRGMLGTLIAIAVLGTAAFLLSDAFKNRLVSIEENTVQYAHGKDFTSVGIRIQSTKNAYQLFLQHPWIGHGTGSFATVYAALPAHEIGDAGPVPLSYNNYLNVAVELGVIGLIFLIFMFALQWRYSFYLQGEWQYLIQVVLISIILGCLANPWLSDTTELHFYALFLAAGFSTLQAKKMRKTASPQSLDPALDHSCT